MSLIDFSTRTANQTRFRSARTVGRQKQALILIILITFTFLLGLGGRLFYLQIGEGERNRQLADENRIRLIPKQAERGEILDRKNRILAGSRLSYSVFLYPIAVEKSRWTNVRNQLAQLLNLSEAEIQKRLDQAENNSATLVRLARGLNPAQITALKEHKSELPGIEVDIEPIRNYPNGDLAAHILGYTGEITDEAFATLKNQGYNLGDIVGQAGIEAVFEDRLRGERGGQQVEVDGSGQIDRILGEKPVQAGQDVRLTLDLDLQKAAERALGDRNGAVVAIDPNTGAVLAMASRPTFDPNMFSNRMTKAQWQQLQRQAFPFVNRTIQAYPPASTFKIVTATAGLESGKFSSDSILPTYPYLEFGGIRFWDWNKAGFGALGFTGAMAQSSNTFFGQVGASVGETMLIQWARNFGFGQKTGIELAGEEARGLVPDAAWKQTELNEDWYIGDTINLSIGQGAMQATPLQVAVMFAAVANGGDRVTPHLLSDRAASAQRRSLNLSSQTLSSLRQGLRQVVSAGTGQALNVPSLPAIAGKSGTAEDPPRQSHTWFGAYAPADKPEIVVVAFAENSGGGGGSVAAPMVRQVLETYFNGTQATGAAQAESIVSD